MSARVWATFNSEDQRRQRCQGEEFSRARWTTQRSVNFVRRLGYALREKLAEAAVVPRLAQLYASLA